MKARAPKITETAEHRVIASYFRKIGLGPGALAIHVRNENGSAWERMIGNQMGVMKGIPDWLIIHEGRAGFIELKPRGWLMRKARTNNFTAHEQRQLDTQQLLRDAGCWVQVCETLEDVIEALRQHGVPLRSESISTERIRNGMTNALREEEK